MNVESYPAAAELVYPNADNGIADGDLVKGEKRALYGDEIMSKDGNVIAPNRYDANHWQECSDHWVYWRVKPAKGLVHP